MKGGILIIVLGLLVSCTTNPVDQVMQSGSPQIAKVRQNLDQHEVQILFTQIDTTDTGTLEFTDHEFQLKTKNYFYPASTVKLPMAVLAAEYVAQHPELNLDVKYVSSRDSAVHTIADDIRQIFAVSDNEAYNRLYEALGRDYINNRMAALDVGPFRLAHRLSTTHAARADRSELRFFPTYEGQPLRLGDTTDSSLSPITVKKAKKGIGYIKEGALKMRPFDFDDKNYFPLETQHGFIKRLFFPAAFSQEERLQLTPAIRQRLTKAMKQRPREAGYDQESYPDSYVKFFLFGDSESPIPDHITIYNKVGYAYGTLTETAYIVDTQAQVHFLLSATVLVNENGIFNDDQYQYESIGIPFLAQLGRELHQFEIDRKASL
ncbi:MAG: hypothetical protein CL867_06890 [Cytophagaceae bacterium]|nr:hypothetical protein [Cytophagaceae bacterium]